MLKSFKKAEIQLASVLTNEDTEETTSEDNGDDDRWEECKCFNKQPLFVTEEIDGCQLCQQMQTGICLSLIHI